MEFKVITEHKLPQRPISGGNNNPLMVGVLAALGCAAATLYVMDYLDKSVRTIDQLEEMMDIPVLAGIPEYGVIEERVKVKRKRK